MNVDVVTFGCRLNAYESEVIRRQAQAAGLADAVVVNTSAVILLFIFIPGRLTLE